MATVAVARPTQPLRRPARPNVSSAKRAAPSLSTNFADDGGSSSFEPASKKRFTESHVRTKDSILRKFAGKPPSLVLHLHQTYFRFDSQEGSWAYDGPMRFIIQHIRNQEIPHEMLEDMRANHVPFYDGCLIVEVHNHKKTSGKDRSSGDDTAGDDQVRNSMHNYNNYITPSPFAPFPAHAKAAKPDQPNGSDAKDKAEHGPAKDGPRIATIVLFPTELSLHHEMRILASTPASERRGTKSKTGEQPPTPQLAVAPSLPPPTNKMALEPDDMYAFLADYLVATEPPLLLAPVDGPAASQKALESLAHPLHSSRPPSSKSRKRTTAEMAADDEKAAESERRMLIMDERIKPSTGSGAAASENAGSAAALGFSRFKTIQMVREKHEEQERQKKEEEAQAAIQRRQQEEANAAHQAALKARQDTQRAMLQQRQNMARQQAELRAQQQAQMQQQAQQAAMIMAQQQHHGHPQQNNMMMNQQNFQHHPSSLAQSSPVVRQQTPSMVNSSPMVPQGGFPMAVTTSQGPGSPQRPTSASMQNPNVAMARQVSQSQQQQQHPSRNTTPHIQQATPNMAGVMPNRQPTQTPRMPHSSPAPGTPAANHMSNMTMQAPQGNMTPEQFAMLQARQQMQQNAMSSASPGQQQGAMANNMSNMTPEQIQHIRQQQQFRAMMQQAQGNPQMAQALAARQAMMLKQQQQQQMIQQRQIMLQQQQQQQQNGGSPHLGMQHTPQMNQGHSQGGDGQQIMTPQQIAARQQMQQQQIKQAQHTLAQLTQQYQGLMNVPQHVKDALSKPVKALLEQQAQRQQAARAQAMAASAQQAQHQGQAVAGTSGGNPEYMQTLRANQAMLQQQRHGNMNNANMGMNMNMGGNQQFNRNQNGDLDASFQAMQRALQNQSNRNGMGQ